MRSVVELDLLAIVENEVVEIKSRTVGNARRCVCQALSVLSGSKLLIIRTFSSLQVICSKATVVAFLQILFCS